MKRKIFWCRIVMCGAVLQTAAAQQANGTQQMSIGQNQSIMAAIQQPVTAAPYRAEKVTRSVQTLSDGTIITHETRGMIARDNQGRMREELYITRFGNIDGSQLQSDFQSATVGDPVAHTILFWSGDKTRIAMQMQFPTLPVLPNSLGILGIPPPPVVLRRPSPRSQGTVQMLKEDAPPPSNAMPIVRMPMTDSPVIADIANSVKDDVRTEQLGKQSIEGVLVTGKRVTTTIPAFKVGNDRPIVVVHEEWQSPELKIMVKTIDSDPRTGEQTMELLGLTRADPDPGLFQAPAGYQIKNMADVMKGLGSAGKTGSQ